MMSSSSLPSDSRAVSGGAPAVGSTGAVRWPGSAGGARRGTSGASEVQERRGAVSSGGGGRYGGGSAQRPGLVGRPLQPPPPRDYVQIPAQIILCNNNHYCATIILCIRIFRPPGVPPTRSPEPGAIAHLRARLHAGRHDDVWHLGLPPRSFAPSPRGMLRHGRGPNSPRLSMGPSTRLPRVQQSSRQTSWRLHPRPSYGRPIPTLVSAMILTPTLPSLASSAFVDNLAEFPCG